MQRLARAQVREVDRIAIERYHVPGVVLMENAARAVTDAALEMLAGIHTPTVLILCGGGNNGGDGLAVARHLHNHGHQVLILLASDPSHLHGDALINWRIVHAIGLPWRWATPAEIAAASADLIIDALLGTGLTAAPREPVRQVIDAINSDARAPVLAVDLPSGLDCDTGQPLGACVRAARTVTFVAEKAGFANPDAAHFTGQVTVGDIGCPREIIAEVLRTSPQA